MFFLTNQGRSFIKNVNEIPCEPQVKRRKKIGADLMKSAPILQDTFVG